MSKRSKILVDPPVQWAIARRIVIHWGLFLTCLVTISVMVRLMFSAGDLPFTQALAVAIRSQVPILIVMFFLMPVFLRDTLKMSNRFAGPMYRLRTALGKMSQGEIVSSINFRNGDFWQEVAADFNTVAAKYEATIKRNEELEAELAQLKNHASV
tara:strand:+ start:70506 stop:70970 length:465 start_codon:yes stop_codon:yes gene_type:complete